MNAKLLATLTTLGTLGFYQPWLSTASADTFTLTAVLNQSQMVFPAGVDPGTVPVSTATGDAKLVVDTATGGFVFDLSVTGIDPADFDNSHGGNNTSTHVHVGDPTQRGAIILDVQHFAESEPGGVLTGGPGGFTMHAQGTLANDGGTGTSIQGAHNTLLTVDTIFDILSGPNQSYITVHTLPDFAFGEIRGNLIPEPATASLLVLGGLLLVSRRSPK